MSGWALLVWVAVPTVVLVGFLHTANTTAVYGSVFTWVEACVYFLWTYFEPTNEKTFFFTGFSLSMALVSPALACFQGVSRDGHAL